VAPAAASTAEEPAVAPLDGPAVAAAAASAPLVDESSTAEATPATPAEASRPNGNKRNSSIFGNLSSRFGPKKSTSEAAPAVPAKDETVVTSPEAPVIPAPEASEPLAASVASPATVPTETITNGTPAAEAEEATPEDKVETKAETKPETKSSARKSSLPFGLGTKKEKTTEIEGEKTLSPFAKLRQTVKAKTSPKATEKAPEKSEEKSEQKAAEPEAAPEAPATTSEPITSEPIVSEPIHAAQSTPQVSATA